MDKVALKVVVAVILWTIIGLTFYSVSNFITALSFMILAIAILVICWKGYGTVANFVGIFGFFWFFVLGLSCLQLHGLQVGWKDETWACLIIAYLAFLAGYTIHNHMKKDVSMLEKEKITKKSFFRLLVIIAATVSVAFVIEVLIRKEIPIFSKNMSSYMNFGVSGIHYFTVSSCLMLPLSIIYMFKYWKNEKPSIREIATIICINVAMFAIPFLIVSRQLIVITLIISATTVLILKPKLAGIIIMVTAVVGVLGWAVISTYRNQDVEYLRTALEIDTESAADVRLMQVYMYAACGFDNFNVNVGNVEEYTYGRKVLFPAFALTGLKFIIPGIEDENLGRITPRFNTYPVVMKPYQDFGILGIILYMMIIGFLCRYVDRLGQGKPTYIIIKVLLIYCLAITFFNNAFASATIWFYIIMMIAIDKIYFRGKSL
ncbi:oligosaccharide repeat unit polymerase [Candidatus Saccharibacteria bacterium]|nr:oligosaccharide repeat unit polymerase [Candidatus Saccharibacteria bacterium]